MVGRIFSYGFEALAWLLISIFPLGLFYALVSCPPPNFCNDTMGLGIIYMLPMISFIIPLPI